MNFENDTFLGQSDSGAIQIVVPDLQKQIASMKNRFGRAGPEGAAKIILGTAKKYADLAYIISVSNPKAFNSYLARNFERTSVLLSAMTTAFNEIYSDNQKRKASDTLAKINEILKNAQPHFDRAIKKSPKTGDQYVVDQYEQGKISRKEASRKLQIPLDQIPARSGDEEPGTETVAVPLEDKKIPTGLIAAGLGLAAFLSLR